MVFLTISGGIEVNYLALISSILEAKFEGHPKIVWKLWQRNILRTRRIVFRNQGSFNARNHHERWKCIVPWWPLLLEFLHFRELFLDFLVLVKSLKNGASDTMFLIMFTMFNFLDFFLCSGFFLIFFFLTHMQSV